MLRVANDQQQGKQRCFNPSGGLGPEANLPTRPYVRRKPGGAGNGLHGLQTTGRGLGSAAVGNQHGPDPLPHPAGEIKFGRVGRAVSAP